jgi:hypothetical protein
VKADEILKIIERMAAAVAKKPEPVQMAVMVEAIVDHRLSDAEIKKGYVAVRDSPSPWWPTPGEFLAKARPRPAAALITGEGDTIFQMLIDNATSYGEYNPHCGTIYDRRRVEDAHGPAAGIAFAAVASRFRRMSVDDAPFVRKEFIAAFEDARSTHGAPILTPPSHRLTSRQEPRPAISGEVAQGPKSQLEEFRTRVLGIGSSPAPATRVDVEARKADLARQARDLMGAVA